MGTSVWPYSRAKTDKEYGRKSKRVGVLSHVTT